MARLGPLQLWLLLEEKRIPYRMEKINMRSYGDKPAHFLDKVPGGLLPVIELDGRVITESSDIMFLLDKARRRWPVADAGTNSSNIRLSRAWPKFYKLYM
jgi:glutathione S-transferase